MQFVEALVCSEPGKLHIAQLPAPQGGPGVALVKPLRVGICGTDFHIFEGTHPFLKYPRIMGHELAVEIVDPAEDSSFAAGDVCAVNPYLSCGVCNACRAGKPNCCVNISVLGVHEDGGMMGLMAVPTKNLVRATGLSADQCATVEFLSIGAHAVRRGGVTSHDRVLVVGAGPIGLGVALFARLSGGRVTLFDRDPERVDLTRSIAKVDAIAAGANQTAEEVLRATGKDAFDVVFDATGSAPAMERGFDFVAHGGRYVLVSVVKDAIRFMDPDFHRKEMTLLGSRNATSEDFERVIAAIRAGEVPVEQIITHRTTLTGAVQAIPHWTTEKRGLIKAVVSLEG